MRLLVVLIGLLGAPLVLGAPGVDAVTVTQGEPRGHLRDRGRLADTGRSDQCDDTALVEHLGLEDPQLTCQRVERLVPGLFEILDVARAFAQAAGDLGMQAKRHEP